MSDELPKPYYLDNFEQVIAFGRYERKEYPILEPMEIVDTLNEQAAELDLYRWAGGLPVLTIETVWTHGDSMEVTLGRRAIGGRADAVGADGENTYNQEGKTLVEALRNLRDAMGGTDAA